MAGTGTSPFFDGFTVLVGLRILLVEVSCLHSDYHNGYDCSERAIGPSQRPLPGNTQRQKRKTIMPPAGFEPAIPASERPQTHALDRLAAGIGVLYLTYCY